MDRFIKNLNKMPKKKGLNLVASLKEGAELVVTISSQIYKIGRDCRQISRGGNQDNKMNDKDHNS